MCIAGKFITVGWGKKETQFHGSEGKQAAQRKNQVSVGLITQTSELEKKGEKYENLSNVYEIFA